MSFDAGLVSNPDLGYRQVIRHLLYDTTNLSVRVFVTRQSGQGAR
jgi:hypothetical protein